MGTKKEQQLKDLGKGNYAQIPNNHLPSAQPINRNRIKKVRAEPYTFYKTS